MTTALKKGVVINYLPAVEIHDHLSSDKIILATGLNRSIFHSLNIKHTNLTGYEARMESSKEVNLTSYKDKYTNQDFAYMASKNGIIYTLLFSRNGVESNDLMHYQNHLKETTDVTFPKWSRINGSVPLEYNLFKDDYILAGTLSGMIDPFFLSGVVGALISGMIAAIAVIEPTTAPKEFGRCVKNFRIKQHMYQLMQSRLLPDRVKILVVILHTLFKDVGKL